MPPVLSKPTTKYKEKMKLMTKFENAWTMDQDAQYTLEQKRILIRLSRTVMMLCNGRDLIGEVLRKVPVRVETDLGVLKREYEKLVDESLEDNAVLDDARIFQEIENIKKHVWDERYREEVKMYYDYLNEIVQNTLPPLTSQATSSK